MTDKIDTSLRGKIADIIVSDVDWHMENKVPWQGLRAADAILAELMDMIPDLVWRNLSAGFQRAGKDYTLSYYDGMNEPYKLECSSFEVTYHKTEEQAKAAANAHHKAQLPKAMGWTV